MRNTSVCFFLEKKGKIIYNIIGGFMWQIGDVEIKNKVVLAPMAGISNSAYRRIIKEMGAGLIYAEMVSDKAISFGNEKSGRRAAHRALFARSCHRAGGVGYGARRHAHVQHQSRLRLSSRRLCQRRRRRAHAAVPPLREGRRGHFRDEGFFGRAASERENLAVRKGAHRIPVHPLRAG